MCVVVVVVMMMVCFKGTNPFFMVELLLEMVVVNAMFCR